MNLQETIERVARIKQCSGDDEIAHVNEDELFHDFVEAIQNGKYRTKKEIVEVAKEVSKSTTIEFSRWCG